MIEPQGAVNYEVSPWKCQGFMILLISSTTSCLVLRKLLGTPITDTGSPIEDTGGGSGGGRPGCFSTKERFFEGVWGGKGRCMHSITAVPSSTEKIG